jgi:hypothetical protein
VLGEATPTAAGYGGAILDVRYGLRGPRVAVLPRNVRALEGAA